MAIYQIRGGLCPLELPPHGFKGQDCIYDLCAVKQKTAVYTAAFCFEKRIERMYKEKRDSLL